MANQQQYTNPVILGAIVLLGFVIGYFYYSTSLKDQAFVAPIPVPAQDMLGRFKDLSFDFSPIDDFKFRSLQVFGESPVIPGPTGRIDIFAPL